MRVLLVDDEPLTLSALASLLGGRHEVDLCGSGDEALARLRASAYDLLMTDLSMPPPDGFEVLRAANSLAPGMPVVVVTGLDTARAAVQAMRLGARDILVKPASACDVHALLDRLVIEQGDRGEKNGRYGLVGRSAAIRRVQQMVPLLARCRETVLVTGETGTGKEVLARAIHDNGPRSQRPMVAHNMAATPSELAESIFFGHARGAFSGATQDQAGVFELADDGTLFLDEVDSFPLPLQAKLLRLLEDGRVRTLGGKHERQVDVRVIAASAVDLGDLVARGQFRADLYFRLRQIEIHMPPLREHLDDVPLLAEHFLAEFGPVSSGDPRITPQAMSVLGGHSWPGNCRELRNALRSACVLAGGQPIRAGHLPPALGHDSYVRASSVATLVASEREQILRALKQSHGNRSQAARLLGIDRGTLSRKLRAMGPENEPR